MLSCLQLPNVCHILVLSHRNVYPTVKGMHNLLSMKLTFIKSLKHQNIMFITYTDNLFITSPCYEQMLLIWIRIKFHTVWNFSACKSTYASTSFCIPQFYITVISSRQKSFPIIIKAYVSYSLTMTIISSDTSSFFINFPQL